MQAALKGHRGSEGVESLAMRGFYFQPFNREFKNFWKICFFLNFLRILTKSKWRPLSGWPSFMALLGSRLRLVHITKAIFLLHKKERIIVFGFFVNIYISKIMISKFLLLQDIVKIPMDEFNDLLSRWWFKFQTS